jgi:Mycothiol maleylpyruvate isomerase N-terminal domain
MQTRAEQIAAIRADQQFWRDLAAEVGPARYAEPGPMGAWSFGDLAGHLLGWRNRSIARVEAAARGEAEPPPLWPAQLDDDDMVNVWIHDQHAGRPPEQLVADYDASYDRLIRALEAVPDDLFATVIPWIGEPLVNIDFIDHLHDEHVPSVRAWLDDLPHLG